MSGIIGYIGGDGDRTLSVVANGLERLEYFGCDSAGVAIDDAEGFRVIRREGEVADLVQELETTQFEAPRAGIGHTRWSTHGEPSMRNTHPHTDCTGTVAVIHNGIIDNYEPLRKRLKTDGHIFKSETDTEVIPHLIEAYRATGDSPVEAFRNAVNDLEGSYTVVALFEETHKLFATRHGSPLILGLGDESFYLASDVYAFIEYTDQVVYLHEGDFVTITPNSYEITDGAGQSVSREVQRVKWNAETASKEGYEHFMLKEIHEHPEAVRNCLSERGNDTVDLASKFLDPNSDRTIYLVGSGTSYHAALYGARLFSEAGLDARATLASEFDSDAGTIADSDVLIVLSQTGETADTLQALHTAKDAGVRTLAITNIVGSTASQDADSVFYIHAGPDISIAATKTFITQMLSLLLLYDAGNLGAERPESPSNEEKSRIDPDTRKSISTALAAIDTPDDAAQAVRQAYEQYTSVKPTALTAEDALNIRQSMAHAQQIHRSKWVQELAPQLQAYFAAAEESLLMPPSRSVERRLSPAEVREILALRETRFQSGIEAAFEESENSETIEELQRAYLWRVWDAIDVYGDFEQVHTVVEKREPPMNDLQTLPGSIQTIIEQSSAPDIAEEYADADAYFFIGRGLHYPVALEGALKLKEICYEHAEGFAAGELKHGPLALVTHDTPVFAMVTGTGDNAKKTINDIKEVESRGAPVVAVTDGQLEIEQYVEHSLCVPEEDHRVQPILASVQLQLVSYYLASLLDRSIDRPRNLTKSVTLE